MHRFVVGTLKPENAVVVQGLWIAAPVLGLFALIGWLNEVGTERVWAFVAAAGISVILVWALTDRRFPVRVAETCLDIHDELLTKGFGIVHRRDDGSGLMTDRGGALRVIEIQDAFISKANVTLASIDPMEVKTVTVKVEPEDLNIRFVDGRFAAGGALAFGPGGLLVGAVLEGLASSFREKTYEFRVSLVFELRDDQEYEYNGFEETFVYRYGTDEALKDFVNGEFRQAVNEFGAVARNLTLDSPERARAFKLPALQADSNNRSDTVN